MKQYNITNIWQPDTNLHLGCSRTYLLLWACQAHYWYVFMRFVAFLVILFTLLSNFFKGNSEHYHSFSVNLIQQIFIIWKKILILECYSHIFWEDNNGTLAQLSSYFIHFSVLGSSDWHAVLSPKFDELQITEYVWMGWIKDWTIKEFALAYQRLSFLKPNLKKSSVIVARLSHVILKGQETTELSLTRAFSSLWLVII